MSNHVLAVDIGNSNTILGLVDRVDLSVMKRLDMPTVEIERELAKNIKTILHGFKNEEIPITTSTVARPDLGGLRSLLSKTLPSSELRFVSADGTLPFSINYSPPSSPGPDRIADCIYACKKYPDTTTIVVDAGTAVNIELLRNGVSYEGGCILPGPALMLDALHRGSARLPSFGVPLKAELPGKSTRQCMESGALYGTAGAVEKAVTAIVSNCTEPVNIIACGGFWPRLAPLVSLEISYEPNCTLLGISLFES